MALIPPFFINCVVAIGAMNNETDPINWIGTGFLFGYLIEETEDKKNKYSVYLVTNKHVINNLDLVFVKFNSQENQSGKDYPLPLKDNDGNDTWFGHPDPEIDVAVIRVNVNMLRSEGMHCNFFESDKSVSTINDLEEQGSSEGDFIYALGFPMGLVGTDRQHVFVRSGIISRIQDLFEKRQKDYIVDAFVFPGNSGGPVLSKPEVVEIKGTKSSNRSSLIGLVKSYIPYRDVAISNQTNRPRAIFEENTGLTKVEPVDHIIETIEIAESKSEVTSD